MKDFKFYKELDPFIYDEIFNWNVYNISESEIKDSNVLDVGGHYGMFTNLCDSYGAHHIISVEANPYNYLKYLKYTRDISAANHAINAAVGPNEGELITISDEGGRSIVGKGDIQVATVTLESLINLFGDDEDIVLKMDIEGAEYDIFYSTSKEVIRRCNIITLEMHQFPDSNHKFYQLNQYIEDCGFKQTWMGSFFTEKDGNKETNDMIAIFKYVRKD